MHNWMIIMYLNNIILNWPYHVEAKTMENCMMLILLQSVHAEIVFSDPISCTFDHNTYTQEWQWNC